MAGHITKPKKPKSKRVSVRLRHRIEKASLAKQRKTRKEAKKNPQWKSKLKKDPGIPNLFPYKEKILHEIEEARRRKLEEQQQRREMAKAAKTGATAGDNAGAEDEDEDDVDEDGLDGAFDDSDMMDEDDDDDGDSSNPMAALLASARAAAEKYDRDLQSGGEMDDDDDDDNEDSDNEDSDGGFDFTTHDSSRKAHDKVFKQVVDQADVVLYVLDARNPEGTRSKDIERMVMAAASGGKRLMLVLNKIDLIPPTVLKDWLAYLRRYFPTLPLRAAKSASNSQTFNHRDLTVQSTSATLFKSLKSFAASKQLKRAVSVGVIGYPNVGKSSVINALLAGLGGRGKAACPAGAEAGVTTSIRAVKIDNKLTLIDSPGIVFPSTTDGDNPKRTAVEEHAHLVLLNAIPPQQIEDPIPAISLLLKKLSSSSELQQKLLDAYDLPALMTTNGDTTTDFLVQVARKRGRLGRGGIPNLPAAAMTVISDWRDGRIQGWTEAPKLPVSLDSVKGSVAKEGSQAATSAMADRKEIVTEWAKEFKLDGLWGNAENKEAEDAMEQ